MIDTWQWGGWTIQFHAEAEDCSPADSFDDDETVAWVLREYNAGNEAAWFCAKITATHASGFRGTDYLGCCSYYSFEDFTDTDGYFADMVHTAMLDALDAASATVTRAESARAFLNSYAGV